MVLITNMLSAIENGCIHVVNAWNCAQIPKKGRDHEINRFHLSAAVGTVASACFILYGNASVSEGMALGVSISLFVDATIDRARTLGYRTSAVFTAITDQRPPIKSKSIHL